MRMRNSKKVGYICGLSILLVPAVVMGIYRYFKYRLDSTELKSATSITTNTMDTSTKDSDSKSKRLDITNNIGNANYFNGIDGKYYSDPSFKTEANDNTEFLLNLFNSEGLVNLPAGNFLCKSKIALRGKNLSVKGIEGKTKIVFDSKTYKNSGLGAVAECLVINNNHAGEYKSDSAQQIYISGIKFEYNRYSLSSPKTIMLFKNIKGASITNCSFIADLGNGAPVTNLDFYNGCKNVTVSDCYFSNKTKALSGGCIWVRNLTAQGVSVEGNTTENIDINKCKFEKNSKDEVIAVYSTIGNIKDITIENCDIKDYATSQEIVLSVYSSEDKYYGTVENVIVNNNSIYSQNFKAFIIMVGIENRLKTTNNVMITNNKIVSGSKNIRKIIIYNAKNNKDSNIQVNNNEITATESSHYIAISNATYVNGNKISGTIENGIVGGGIVTNNVINGVENGIVSPDVVLKNSISQAKYGIKVYNGDCFINGNEIELDEEIGVCGISITSQGSVACINNTINTFTPNQYGIITKSINTILSNNKLVGSGINSIKK